MSFFNYVLDILPNAMTIPLDVFNVDSPDGSLISFQLQGPTFKLKEIQVNDEDCRSLTTSTDNGEGK